MMTGRVCYLSKKEQSKVLVACTRKTRLPFTLPRYFLSLHLTSMQLKSPSLFISLLQNTGVRYRLPSASVVMECKPSRLRVQGHTSHRQRFADAP